MSRAQSGDLFFMSLSSGIPFISSKSDGPTEIDPRDLMKIFDIRKERKTCCGV
jgi:hypothetical protein